jgi:hypothetical protein
MGLNFVMIKRLSDANNGVSQSEISHGKFSSKILRLSLNQENRIQIIRALEYNLKKIEYV